MGLWLAGVLNAPASASAKDRAWDSFFLAEPDTPLARHYLRAFLSGSNAGDPVHESAIRALHGEFDRRPLDADVLMDLTARTSVDFATLYFSRRVWSDPRNAQAYTDFHREFRCLVRDEDCAAFPPPGDAAHEPHARYKILVVPGFHYKSDPSTGADLSGPRRAFQEAGFETALIETGEDDPIEKNAGEVARTIREHGRTEQRLIVVSPSKGSPEAAYALGAILNEEEARRVAAWVSIGGILRGTLLADEALRFPMRWLAKPVLWFQGIRTEALPGMSRYASLERFKKVKIPPHLLTVQYVGVPLSSQVSPDVRGRYRQLAPHGPNDGLTLLADELVPGGIVIIEPGLDHYFRDPNILQNSLALTRTVLRFLEQK